MRTFNDLLRAWERIQENERSRTEEKADQVEDLVEGCIWYGDPSMCRNCKIKNQGRCPE